MSEFGDRPAKVIAAFERLDPKRKGTVQAKRVATLLTMFKDNIDAHFTEEELNEFLQEAVDGNTDSLLEYRAFVKDAIFGAIK